MLECTFVEYSGNGDNAVMIPVEFTTICEMIHSFIANKTNYRLHCDFQAGTVFLITGHGTSGG